jgi:hypothetical protein
LLGFGLDGVEDVRSGGKGREITVGVETVCLQHEVSFFACTCLDGFCHRCGLHARTEGSHTSLSGIWLRRWQAGVYQSSVALPWRRQCLVRDAGLQTKISGSVAGVHALVVTIAAGKADF